MKVSSRSVSRRPSNLRHLLVPVDFSDLSIQTLRYAVDLLAGHGDTLTLVHVVPTDYGLLGIGREDSRDFDRALQKQAAGRLRMLADKLVPQGIMVSLDVRLGRPGAEIVAAAKKLGSDVIVLSTHGRTGMDRYLIGSVAERVARTAPCPVLLVPPTKLKSVSKRSPKRG